MGMQANMVMMDHRRSVEVDSVEELPACAIGIH